MAGEHIGNGEPIRTVETKEGPDHELNLRETRP